MRVVVVRWRREGVVVVRWRREESSCCPVEEGGGSCCLVEKGGVRKRSLPQREESGLFLVEERGEQSSLWQREEMPCGRGRGCPAAEGGDALRQREETLCGRGRRRPAADDPWRADSVRSVSRPLRGLVANNVAASGRAGCGDCFPGRQTGAGRRPILPASDACATADRPPRPQRLQEKRQSIFSWLCAVRCCSFPALFPFCSCRVRSWKLIEFRSVSLIST